MSEGLGYGGYAAEGQMVMPFYIICDVSGSMTHDMPVLNEGIQKLRQSIVQNPVVDDVAHISVISFSTRRQGGYAAEPDERAVHADAGDGRRRDELRQGLPRARAGHSPADAAMLQAQGYKIFRPCAFFLTDGEPARPRLAQTPSR